MVTLFNWRLGFDITDGVGEPRLNLISMELQDLGQYSELLIVVDGRVTPTRYTVLDRITKIVCIEFLCLLALNWQLFCSS